VTYEIDHVQKDLFLEVKLGDKELLISPCQAASTSSTLEAELSLEKPSDEAAEINSALNVCSPELTPDLTEFPSEPLEEDLPIFEEDAKRFAAAQDSLESFRALVDNDFLCKLPAFPDNVSSTDCPSELARRFCTDSTLLRYLCAASCCKDKALQMLKATVAWRASYLSTTSTCQLCLDDPKSHCFIHLGKDSMQRHVIYGCAGRAANKTVAHGMRHMAVELDRIFQGNKEPGSVVFVVDFAGFGLADCNPHIGMLAIPLFANHYPERFSQVVLMSMPNIFRFFLNSAMKYVDPIMQRKVLILNNVDDQKRYANAYWRSNPPMANWFEAVKDCRCQPGCYPDANLALEDEHTQKFLQRCAAESPNSAH
jgi:hypothetical protein